MCAPPLLSRLVERPQSTATHFSISLYLNREMLSRSPSLCAISSPSRVDLHEPGERGHLFSSLTIPHVASPESDPDLEDCCTPGFSGWNLCVVCRVDMGDGNGRQLCGKIVCHNQEEVDEKERIAALMKKFKYKIIIVSWIMGCYSRNNKSKRAKID